MRLADFIRAHMESILVEWEAFAATRGPAAQDMTALELRDHAEQILEAVATDISIEQSAAAQRRKSIGQTPLLTDAPETAAQTHAVLRARNGFDINQLVAEYRALRASVLRLWERANAGEARDLDDVIRFNEAIDQALSESVTFYSAQLEHSRTLLLAMVGHDLRGPLSTIQLGALYLARLGAGDQVAQVSQRMLDGSARMCALLDDLVDFNRSRLGLGIRVSPNPMDLADSFAREIELLRFANPHNPIEFTVDGDLSGQWDERRLQQVLGNLVLNAVKYGTANAPIRVRATGGQDCVSFEVLNAGELDAGSGARNLFDPLARGANATDRHGPESLGLGLYIAREIAVAHGGEISVHPHPGTTVFAVNLPRSAAGASPGGNPPLARGNRNLIDEP